MAKLTIQATVRTYNLDAQFLKVEPGKDKKVQEQFREQIGDLPNQILDLAVGIYDVQVFNQQVVVFYMPAILGEKDLDSKMGDLLASAVWEGRLELRPGAQTVFVNKSTTMISVTNTRIIKRLRHEAIKGIEHYVNKGESCSSPVTQGENFLLARACVADLVSTMP